MEALRFQYTCGFRAALLLVFGFQNGQEKAGSSLLWTPLPKAGWPAKPKLIQGWPDNLEKSTLGLTTLVPLLY